jgi:hypothetical protein
LWQQLQQPQLISVVAPAGQPAYAFTSQTPGYCLLVANGVSNPPTFGADLVQETALVNGWTYAWTNTAGAVNVVGVGSDGWTFSYYVKSGVSSLPTPVSFAATHGTPSIAITYAGGALTPLATITPDAFPMTILRAGANPPISITSAVASSSAVTLTLSANLLLGDSVVLDYNPPSVAPIADTSSPVTTKLFPFVGAVVTIS